MEIIISDNANISSFLIFFKAFFKVCLLNA